MVSKIQYLFRLNTPNLLTPVPAVTAREERWPLFHF